jgi:hypothetical protein
VYVNPIVTEITMTLLRIEYFKQLLHWNKRTFIGVEGAMEKDREREIGGMRGAMESERRTRVNEHTPML